MRVERGSGTVVRQRLPRSTLLTTYNRSGLNDTVAPIVHVGTSSVSVNYCV